MDGLGSYGSYPIPQLGQNGSALDLPVIKKLHYKVSWPTLETVIPSHMPATITSCECSCTCLSQVNWDLSGRFYHYMGMFAPPIDGAAPGRWLNR